MLVFPRHLFTCSCSFHASHCSLSFLLFGRLHLHLFMGKMAAAVAEPLPHSMRLLMVTPSSLYWLLSQLRVLVTRMTSTMKYTKLIILTLTTLRIASPYWPALQPRVFAPMMFVPMSRKRKKRRKLTRTKMRTTMTTMTMTSI